MLDIETSPHLAAVWGLWQQNVALDQIMKPGTTLCWAAKWYGEDEIMFESNMTGHVRMVRRAHKLLSEADAVCHYNGTKFDIPTLNKEFLLLGLSPPPPSKQVDLLRTARSRFRLASNKLDFVAQQLGLGKKEKHKGFQLWLECMARDKDAWKVMESYNKQDVVLLEKVYERLRPWIKNHPNLSTMNEKLCCPKCGSSDHQRRGYARTSVSKYQRFQCNTCGSWFRNSKSLTSGMASFREVT